MTIVLLLGIVLIAGVLELAPAWLRRHRRNRPAPEPAGGSDGFRPSVGDHEPRERALTAQLLAGTIGPAAYRDAMAGLAADDEDPAEADDIAMLVWLRGKTTAIDDPHELLHRLGAALPGIPPATVCSAAALAGAGARADDLIRTLHLTRAQARTIISAVSPR